MRYPLMLLITATLFAASAIEAQQTTQPTTQPAPQAQTTAPATATPPAPGCSAPGPKAPAKPPSGFHFKIPTKVQQVIDANRAKVEDKTGVHVPTTDELKKQITQPPCLPGPAPAPAAPAKPPAAPAAPPATPTGTPLPVNAKP